MALFFFKFFKLIFVRSRAWSTKRDDKAQPLLTELIMISPLHAISQLISLQQQNKKKGKMVLIGKVSQMSAAVDHSFWVIACQTINGFGYP